MFPRNRDGTYRTYDEREYGVCKNRTICFISAGPDRDHGDMHAEPGTVEREKTRDNIFSYTVEPTVEITPP